MQGVKRRIVYIMLFEIIAIVITTFGLTGITGRDIGRSGLVATVVSVLAIVWNLGYNTLFEYLEAKFTNGGRSLVCRTVHAVGFEIGLAVLVVPTLAVMLHIGIWTAFLTNIGIMIFFMFYAFVFNLAFDRVFGLPLSARRKTAGGEDK